MIVLGFNEVLDPTAAQNVQNYTVIGLGPDDHFDTANQIADGHANDVYLHVATATYNAATATVTLVTYEPLTLKQLYLLDVNGRLAHPTASGESPNGLTNTNGVLLDGNFSGQPGSDYVAILPGPTVTFINGRPVSSPIPVTTVTPAPTTTTTATTALPGGPRLHNHLAAVLGARARKTERLAAESQARRNHRR